MKRYSNFLVVGVAAVALLMFAVLISGILSPPVEMPRSSIPAGVSNDHGAETPQFDEPVHPYRLPPIEMHERQPMPNLPSPHDLNEETFRLIEKLTWRRRQQGHRERFRSAAESPHA